MSDSKKLKVEGAVVTPTSPTEEKLPTYKAIPEADIDYKAVQNSNMVKENGENCKDGADEKMLTPVGEKPEVKFIPSQNGDTKLEIDIKQAFTGLTKEELLKFSNDPFWVRLRWIMFIGFWLLWIGMLAGAIVIIIGAPKCAPPPPKTWWQEGPLIEGKAPQPNSDSQWNLTTLLEKLSSLSELKPKGLIIPEEILPGNDAYSVLNSEAPELAVFKNLAEKSKEKNIKLIVDLTANGASKTSDWFNKSEHGELPYKDYFVWGNGKGVEGDERKPPSSWRSMNNQPAWTYSETRKQFYLHQLDENKPDLNFNNPDVVKEFEKVLQFWIKNGVIGVRLSNAQYLLVNQAFEDEPPSTKKVDTNLNDYNFYSHSKTSYQEGLSALLLKWKNVILENTDNQGTLILDGYLEKTEVFKSNGTTVIDLPRTSLIMDESSHSTILQNNNVSKQFKSSISNTFIRLDGSWPSWKYYSNNDELTSEFAIISSLLPGVPIITLNQAFDASSNNTKPSEEYLKLLDLRSDPSFKYGDYQSYLLANETIFAFTRLKSGNPGIMVLFNPENTVAVANTTVMDAVPEKVSVSLLSANYNETNVFVKSQLDSNNIPVSPRSVIVLTYVPSKE